MTSCNCVECDHKCYEYEINYVSDKAYYEWTLKQDKCLQAESERKEIEAESEVKT